MTRALPMCLRAWSQQVWGLTVCECLEKVVEKQGQELSVLLEILCLSCLKEWRVFPFHWCFPKGHLQVTGWTYYPTETTWYHEALPYWVSISNADVSSEYCCKDGPSDWTLFLLWLTDLLWRKCPTGQGLSHRDQDHKGTVPLTKFSLRDDQTTASYSASAEPQQQPCELAVEIGNTEVPNLTSSYQPHNRKKQSPKLSGCFVAFSKVCGCCRCPLNVPDQEVVNRPENWERKRHLQGMC